MIALLLAGLLLATTAQADDAMWDLLKSGRHVLLMRHAARDGECLSVRGREDAKRIGRAFAAHGITVDDVRSSPVCRCAETAALAFGQAKVWAPLDSFDGALEREAEQTGALREVISRHSAGLMVFVTHNFNIVALTRIYLEEGEMLVLTPRAGAFIVSGRLAA